MGGLGTLVSGTEVLVEPSKTGGDRIVRMGVLDDNAPFSYRNADRQIVGFAVDLAAAIESTMGLRLDRVIGSTKAINGAFEAGRLDLLQTYASAPERESYAEFSVPYLMLSGAIVVRDGEAHIRTLADLRGRKVMVHRGSVGEIVLRKAGLDDSIVLVDSVEQALRKLDAGENDATLASRLTTLSVITELGLRHVHPIGDAVPGYRVWYCFAVRRGDRELLSWINEGLAVLQRSGEYDRIYRKWFGNLERPGYTREQIVTAVLIGLALALVVAVWAASRQRTLRRLISAQAVQLQASEERYRTIFESSLEALLVLSASESGDAFTVDQLNPAAIKLLRLPQPPPAGVSLAEICPEPALVASIAAATRPDAEAVFEFQSQSLFPPVRLQVTVSRLGGRVLLGLSDITRERLAEERLRQGQKLDAIGTLASGIAHDFNNILTGISIEAELGRLTATSSLESRSHFDQILRSAKRAAALVRQILTFSRRAEVQRGQLSLTPVVKETLSFIRSTSRIAVDIRHITNAGDAKIEGDSTELHQVVMNLCTNAVQAMRDRPSPLLEVSEDLVAVEPGFSASHPGLRAAQCLRISVKDNGAGMSRNVVDRIFEPFFTTKPAGEGTGLGLSVVHGIVQTMGGAITVQTEPGHGTTFHLFFPLALGPAATVADATAAPRRGGNELVMLVDDESIIVDPVAASLRNFGYRVAGFSRPDDALRDFSSRTDRVSVLITDLTMPGMNGLELILQCRKSAPDLPVVLLTGFLDERESAQVKKLSRVRIVEKPFVTATLCEVVAGAIASNGS